MANCVVWMDQGHAKIFELHPEEVTETVLRRHEIRHHMGREKEQNNHKNLEKFFHEVAEKLSSANEIFLVGPGLAKDHFKAHLTRHHHGDIGQKIVGSETVDHPTDAQIIAQGRKFFKAHLRLEKRPS